VEGEGIERRKATGMNIRIRPETAADHAAIRQVNRVAFRLNDKLNQRHRRSTILTNQLVGLCQHHPCPATTARNLAISAMKS